MNIVRDFVKQIQSHITRIGWTTMPTTTIRPLGRWNIESCQTRTDKKIDLSNEDHCGPCGEYRLSVVPKPSKALVTTQRSEIVSYVEKRNT